MISGSLSNHLRQEPVELFTDAELATQFRDGSERAFNLLVARWNEPVFNFCLRLMGDHDDASDCSQRTFIKIYQKIGSLDNPEAFRSWLFQIALNQCRDEIKKRKRFSFMRLYKNEDHNEETSFAEDTATEEISDNSPEHMFKKSELKDVLEKALNRLSVEQREVVIMKELHQFTFPEIANILGISENTIKSRLYAGLRVLARILSKQHIQQDYLS